MFWFMVIVIVILRDCGSIWLYDISLTHIRYLTPPFTQKP